MARKYTTFFGLFLSMLALDQITKIWVWTSMTQGRDEIELIPGFLSIVHAQNPGAAFGILDTFEYRYALFGLFTLVACWIVVDMWRKLPVDERYLSGTLGLILSGAVGNGIDRVHKQTVTDFIRVYTDNPSLKSTLLEWFGTYEWPTFNVADIALFVGVALFLFHGQADESATPTAADLGATPEPR